MTTTTIEEETIICTSEMPCAAWCPIMQAGRECPTLQQFYEELLTPAG